MVGMGTIVNAIAILAGAMVGLFLRRGLPEKYQESIMHGLSLRSEERRVGKEC